MAVPKRRTSKTRKNKRRTHFKISVPGMTECPNCGEYKLFTAYVKTVVLTMVKKSFLNNLYLLKKGGIRIHYEFYPTLFLYYLNLYHCYQK